MRSPSPLPCHRPRIELNRRLIGRPRRLCFIGDGPEESLPVTEDQDEASSAAGPGRAPETGRGPKTKTPTQNHQVSYSRNGLPNQGA
jgi:hypothetical protein